MNPQRYTLEPLPKLHFDKKPSRGKHCPCGKINKDGKFVPYIGFDDKGYCHSCGKKFLPELPQKETCTKPVSWFLCNTEKKTEILIKPVTNISFDIFKQSLQRYEANNFIKFLINLFGVAITKQVIETYFIGTSKYWSGATVFWQIDITGKLRAGKIMLYNCNTGKRIKPRFCN
jgi:hypothetical protein